MHHECFQAFLIVAVPQRQEIHLLMLVGLLCIITGGINSSTKVHSFVGYVTLQYIPHTKQHIISH